MTNEADIYDRVIGINDLSSPGDIPGDMKSNADSYARNKISKLENQNTAILRFLGICISVTVISLVTMVIDVTMDKSVSNSFNEKQLNILNHIRNLELEINDIKNKQEGMQSLIEEMIENRVDNMMLEFYKEKVSENTKK